MHADARTSLKTTNPNDSGGRGTSVLGGAATGGRSGSTEGDSIDNTLPFNATFLQQID